MAWVSTNDSIGLKDLIGVDTIAPGTGTLPGTPFWPFLGATVTGYETSTSTIGIASGGEFIYLAIPASTTIAAGTIVTWNPSYQVAAMPTTSGNSGRPVAVAIQPITSSTSVQYAWFQRQGRVAVLKTAVTVPSDSRLFVSGTAGRFYVTASAGKQIIGARTVNAASITSTTSTVLVYIDRPTIQGV